MMRTVLLGRRDQADTEAAMRDWTAARTPDTADELWIVEHDPVYTLGVAGRDAHLRDPGGVPAVRSTRGGQVTYHGPGQVVAYPLVDLRRLHIHVKDYVFRLEQALLDTLAAFGVTGHRVAGAPGIYVRLDDPFGHARLQRAVGDGFDGIAKIAALGIKVSRHCTWHGVALNVAMDLAPFARIDACGYPGLATTDLRTLGVDVPWDAAAAALAAALQQRLAAG